MGGLLFVILTNYLRILTPQITGYIVNSIVYSINNKTPDITHSIKEYHLLVNIIIHSFDQLGFRSKILFVGLVLIGLAILSGFFMFLMRQTLIVMSRHIEYDQKNEIYEQYQKLSLNFYKKQQTGDLMNRITEDVSRVRMYTGPALMYFFNLAAVIGFSLYFMFQSDVMLTWVALSPLPFLAISIYYVNAIIYRKSEKIQSNLSSLTANAQESYSGIRVIKSFTQEKSMMQYFNKNSEDYKKTALSLAKTESIYFPSMSLMIGISTLITIMVGGIELKNGVSGASVGKITEFVLYIQMLTFPVSAIGWTVSMIQRAAASQQRINEFLLTQPEIKNDPLALKNNFLGSIEFCNSSFVYENTGIKALQSFSLKINKGEKIAIIGKTGSGKSTIAQLLLRQLELNEGQLLLDGIAIDKIDLTHLRKSISYVPQDVFLFSDTIANNISFGKEFATETEIIDAAKKACIYKEIISFPDGFNTIIGERGITLSGGQKQRLSIARALIKKPELLIFDDCLSAVDTKTEHEILENLESSLSNHTSIFITHRAIVNFKFNKIIVLDNGKIAEMGTHEELLKLRGLYAEIHRLQTENVNN